MNNHKGQRIFEVNTIALSDEGRPPYVLPAFQDEKKATHRLQGTLYLFSALEVALWVIPAQWKFDNVEHWQSAYTEDGKWRVFLVYRMWLKGGGGAAARYSTFAGLP